MNNSALFPPSYAQLSDSLVGDVVQRPQPRDFPAVISRPARLPALSLIANLQKTAPPSLETTSAKRKSSLERAKSPTERKRLRERNRMHQAKYKLKQRKLEETLVQVVAQLQQQIQQLEVQRQVLSANTATCTTVWNIAAEYFNLFRKGVKASLTSEGLIALHPQHAKRQRGFILQTMTSDVSDGIGQGIDAFLEAWKRVSFFSGDIDISLMGLEIGPEGSLVASTNGVHYINENTLRFAFPNVVSEGEEKTALTPLAEKLFGQRILVHGTVRFGWDEELMRVTSVEYKVDMLTPLLKLLGNLEDVSRVFDNARLTPECRLVVDRDL